jgi:polysaccharide biosynthesis/export protein
VATIKASTFLVIALLFAAPAYISAQSNENPSAAVDTPPVQSRPNDTAAKDPDRPVLQHRNPRYKIQRGDGLTLAFPLSSEFDQTLTVQPDGYVNLRGIGGLYIQGMTVPEAVEAFKKAYSTILHDPIIDLDLTDFQKPMFIVSGQVGKPGQYELRNDITVSEAIAVAGGFTPQAKTQVFLYRRVSPGWVQVRRLNLKEILNGKNVNEDARMQEGDMVFVPEKFITNFRKYVPYSVGMYLNPASIL